MTGKKVDGMIMITPFVEDSAREVEKKFNITICDSLPDLADSVKNT
ncbi:hypothetical protein [Methanospirillum purgamenti]